MNNYFQNKTAERLLPSAVYLCLYLIDSLQQLLHINVRIDFLGQRHCTRMTDDLLYQRRRYLFLGHHRDTRMTGIMWLVSAANQLHNRCPVGIVIVTVDELLAVGSMEQILVPIVLFVGQHFVNLICRYLHKNKPQVRLRFICILFYLTALPQ